MGSCNIPGQGENLKVSIKREVKKRSATMKLGRGGGKGERGRGSKGFIMRFVAGELMPFRWSGCLHDTSSQDTTVYDVCAYIFDDIKIGTRENFYGVLIIDTRVEFFVFFFFLFVPLFSVFFTISSSSGFSRILKLELAKNFYGWSLIIGSRVVFEFFIYIYI